MGAVLIVESSGFLCRLLGTGLTRANLAFVGARSFQAAVDAIQSETPGLILLDLDLPGKLDIEKACKLIKNVRRCKEVPIILVCSKDAGIEEKVKRTGSVGYLRKPISPAFFMEWLDQHKDIKKKIRKASEPPEAVHHKKEKATIIRKTAVKKEPAKDAAGKAAKSAEEIAKSEPPKEPTVEEVAAAMLEEAVEDAISGPGTVPEPEPDPEPEPEPEAEVEPEPEPEPEETKAAAVVPEKPQKQEFDPGPISDESKVVLIVQDSVKLAKSARKHSDVEDLIFVLARTFDEATEWIDKVRPAAIVFDMELDCTPKPAKACKMLRLWADDPIPLVLLVPEESDENDELVKSVGAETCLEKPVSGRELVYWLELNAKIVGLKLPSDSDDLLEIEPVSEPEAELELEREPVSETESVSEAEERAEEEVVAQPQAEPDPDLESEAGESSSTIQEPYEAPDISAAQTVVVTSPLVPSSEPESSPASEPAPESKPEPTLEPTPELERELEVESEPEQRRPFKVVTTDIDADATQLLVLIVDGNHSSLEVFNADEIRQYCTIVAASSAEEAAQLLKAVAPAVMFVDFGLQDLPGDAVCGFVKSIPSFYEVPVFLFLEQPAEEVQDRISDCGADGYMMKPIDPDEFLLFLYQNGLINLEGSEPKELSASLDLDSVDPPYAEVVPRRDFPKAAEPLPHETAPVYIHEPVSLKAEPVSLKPVEIKSAPLPPPEDIVKKMQARTGAPVPDGFAQLAERTANQQLEYSFESYNLAMQLYAGTVEEQTEACLEFGRQRVTDAVPVLTGIIARGNENLIAEACWSLGEIGDRRAVSTLIQVLQRNERLFVLKALEALGKVGDRSATPYIIACLAACEDELKLAIVNALALIGGETAVKGLELLAEDDDYTVAQKATAALEAVDRSPD